MNVLGRRREMEVFPVNPKTNRQTEINDLLLARISCNRFTIRAIVRIFSLGKANDGSGNAEKLTGTGDTVVAKGY